MFLQPSPTPYDLRWRMFGIGVRVHPGFWIFSAILGWHPWADRGFGYLFLWIGCTFVSILVHELGHVIASRLSGEPADIVLYSFGGLAVGNYHRVRPWQRIFIYCAGPGAGFALYGLTVLFQNHALWRIDPTVDMFYLRRALDMLWFMNLFWNLLNLIPVFPLDGGQVSREVCTLFSGRRGFSISLGLSFVIAGLIAVYSLMKNNRPELPYPPLDPTFNIIMFGLLAVQSFQMMRSVEQERRRWERDQDFW